MKWDRASAPALLFLVSSSRNVSSWNESSQNESSAHVPGHFPVIFRTCSRHAPGHFPIIFLTFPICVCVFSFAFFVFFSVRFFRNLDSRARSPRKIPDEDPRSRPLAAIRGEDLREWPPRRIPKKDLPQRSAAKIPGSHRPKALGQKYRGFWGGVKGAGGGAMRVL